MIFDPSVVQVPDDTGSDTFNRYRYQAHVAFRFCLDCGLGGGVKSVVMEHIEDIVIELHDQWRFCQIKTRNPERGPWRISDLAGDNGILAKLHRTHEALGSSPATIELLVEGAIKPKDAIELLKTPEGRRNEGLRSRVRAILGLSDDECCDFLDRVRFLHGLPSRPSIAAENLLVLTAHASHLPGHEIQAIYLAAIERIEQAMEIIPASRPWFDLASNDATAADNARLLYNDKRLAIAELAPILARIASSPKPVLKRLVTSSDASSTMVLKLEAGGATSDMIDSAKQLRANAALRRLEWQAASIFDPEDVLEDLHERLMLRVRTLRAVHDGSPSPAVAMWMDLLNQLPNWCPTVDSVGVYQQDPDLLLGELCDLSDQCKFDWGITGA